MGLSYVDTRWHVFSFTTYFREARASRVFNAPSQTPKVWCSSSAPARDGFSLAQERCAQRDSIVGCHSAGAAWRCWRRTPTHRPARSCQAAKALRLRLRIGRRARREPVRLALERMSPDQPLAARATARASSKQHRRGTPAPRLSSPRCVAPSRRPAGDRASPPTLAKASPRTATRAPQRSGPAPRPASAHARRAAAAVPAPARGGEVQALPRWAMLGFGRATSRWRCAAGR